MSAFKEGHEAVTLIYGGGPMPHEEEFTTAPAPANTDSQETPQEAPDGQ